MNLAKKLTAVFLVIAMVLCFAACSTSEEETGLDIGTINMGFIATGDVEEDPASAVYYNQFRDAYKLAGSGDGQVTVENKVKPDDADAMAKAMDDLLARGCRLIIGTNPGYKDAFVKFADENKNVFFALPGDNKEASTVNDNLALLDVKKFEAEYLEGIAAGLSTETNKVAYIAEDALDSDINAFAKGVKKSNSGAEVFYISTEDVKEGVDKAIEKGCDVVYSANFVADEESGEMFFTVPESMNNVMTVNKIGKDGNEFVTGIGYNMDFLYTKVLLNTVNRSFGDLSKFSWGIKDGVFDVSPAKDEKIKSAVDAAKDKLMAGDNVVSAETEKLNADITVL